MNSPQKVHDALNTISALGSRIHPGGKLPDAPTYPLALYQFVGNLPSAGYVYQSRKTDFHPQITLMAKDYPTLLALRLATIGAMEAMAECAARELDFEPGFDFTLEVYIWHLQFQLNDIET